jgi:hypothetical protein
VNARPGPLYRPCTVNAHHGRLYGECSMLYVTHPPACHKPLICHEPDPTRLNPPLPACARPARCDGVPRAARTRVPRAAPSRVRDLEPDGAHVMKWVVCEDRRHVSNQVLRKPHKHLWSFLCSSVRAGTHEYRRVLLRVLFPAGPTGGLKPLSRYAPRYPRFFMWWNTVEWVPAYQVCPTALSPCKMTQRAAGVTSCREDHGP